MIIRSLQLKNIRSYRNAQIDFSEGITLLAGDIGSGKSSILLAIEFALFGIRRGELAGDALLRHGETEGSVTLSFFCKQEITIHRVLKRSKNGVRQDDGFLEISGNKEPYTAKELKARILDILGYPQELLSKSKGLIFRYSVYTPQEQMKHILFEPPQERLDTLRSVFGVDKYKLVQENGALVTKKLREQLRFIEGQLKDVPTLTEEKELLEKQQQTIEQELALAKTTHDQATQALNNLQEQGKLLEQQFEQEQKRKQEVSRIEATLNQLNAQKTQIDRDAEQLEKRQTETLEEITDPAPSLKKLSELRELQQTKRSEARAKHDHAKRQIKELENIEQGVSNLETCPTCKQPVTQQHKDSVTEHNKSHKFQLNETIQKATKIIDTATNNLNKIQTKEAQLRTQQTAFNTYQVAKKRKEDAKMQFEQLTKRKTQLEADIKTQEEQKTKQAESTFDEQAYKNYKQELTEKQKQETDARVILASTQTRKQSLSERITSLTTRLAEKQSQKSTLTKITQYEQWMNSLFLPVTGMIESRVLASIHAEFSAKFTQWFSQLVEDDAMFAQLSQSFAPEVTQDGYDVDVQYLSGGEKTAVALAYRLALNSIITEFLHSINTAGVLILDEPTDGFSSQQLDRVRDVLIQLSCKQLLIVSHEPKMESFVDHVIRVQKQEHASIVAS